MSSSGGAGTESRTAMIARQTPVVFVVDDDVSVRESVELLIRSAGWHPETFASAEDFLARSRIDGPSCLVLDVTLPNLNGLDLQKRIIDRSDMPIIFISGYGDVPTTVRAMKAGAAEFLTKPLADEVLRQAITQAIDRSYANLAQGVELREIRHRHESLTPRQREIMELVVSGLSNRQIGRELGISEITVKAHRGQVMRKMRVDSLADLVRVATALGVPLVARRLIPRCRPTLIPRCRPTLIPRCRPTLIPRCRPTLIPRCRPTLIPRCRDTIPRCRPTLIHQGVAQH